MGEKKGSGHRGQGEREGALGMSCGRRRAGVRRAAGKGAEAARACECVRACAGRFSNNGSELAPSAKVRPGATYERLGFTCFNSVYFYSNR